MSPRFFHNFLKFPGRCTRKSRKSTISPCEIHCDVVDCEKPFFSRPVISPPENFHRNLSTTFGSILSILLMHKTNEQKRDRSHHHLVVMHISIRPGDASSARSWSLRGSDSSYLLRFSPDKYTCKVPVKSRQTNTQCRRNGL